MFLFLAEGAGFAVLSAVMRQVQAFMDVQGRTPELMAPVFLIFAGLGALAGGWAAQRRRAPLLFFARMALAGALLAVVSPQIASFAGNLYGRWAGPASRTPGGLAILRLLTAAMAGGGIAMFCGVLPPSAVRVIQDGIDDGRRRLGLIFAAGFGGALAGVMGGYLLYINGMGSIAWQAAVLLLLIAVAANNLARFSHTATPPGNPSREVPIKVKAALAVFSMGLSLYAAAWMQMLAPLVGPGLSSGAIQFSLLLGGTAAGCLFFHFRGARSTALLNPFAMASCLLALFSGLIWTAGDGMAVLAAGLRPFWGQGAFFLFLAKAMACAPVLLPMGMVSGYFLCFLESRAGKGLRDAPWQTGAVLFFAAAGCCLGLLLATWWLLPALGGRGLIRLASMAAACAAVGAALCGAAVGGARRDSLQIIPISLLIALLFLTPGPTNAWLFGNYSMSGVNLSGMGRNEVLNWLRLNRRKVVWQSPGLGGNTAVSAQNGYALEENGVTRCNVRGDAAKDVMAGLAPAILHPNPRTALVLGLGSGAAAGWLAQAGSIERVHVVEPNPQSLEMARLCAPANENVLDNPKVTVEWASFRDGLLFGHTPQDIIVMGESQTPALAEPGLYTLEFFQQVEKRLNPGGVFCVCLDMDGVTPEIGRSAIGALGRVFPYVHTWRPDPGNLYLMCSGAPITFEASAIKQKVGEFPYSKALAAVWGVAGAEGFLSRYIAGPGYAALLTQRAAEDDAVNTDANSLANALYENNTKRFVKNTFLSIRDDAFALDQGRPSFSEGALSLKRSQDFYAEMYLMENQAIVDNWVFSSEQTNLASACEDFLAGNYGGFLLGWRQLAMEPGSPMEQAMIAQALAWKGDHKALDLARELQVSWPAVADAAAARYYWTAGQKEPALRHLGQALIRFRSDPWPWPLAMERALELGEEMAASDKAIAFRVLPMLEKPFCLKILEERRLEALLAVASCCGDREAAGAMEQYGDFGPWTRDYLARQFRVYKALGHPRAAAATFQLERFLSSSVMDFTETSRQ